MVDRPLHLREKNLSMAQFRTCCKNVQPEFCEIKKPSPYGTIFFSIKELENYHQITTQLSPRWNKLTEFPMPFRYAVLQARKRAHFISAFSIQKQPGSSPFYSLKLNQGVPFFILTSSLRRLFFPFFCLSPNIHYSCCFTNGHHNSLHPLLQCILCVVSVSPGVSGQGGHIWCCVCKSTMHAWCDRKLLLKCVFSQ